MVHTLEIDHDERARDLLVGARLHKYEVRREIGRGGMGRVYEAWNPTIGKRVAIKVLDGLVDENGIERFLREARAASAIESPHIVQIFDTGEADDGRPFIVMELLRGRSLADHVVEGPLAADEVVRVAIQIARGLARAHDAGIIHRDLKPENIFLVEATPAPPIVKILDFGIAKWSGAGPAPSTLTREGDVLGTPAYMSPEQARGDRDLDARTDLWSLGAIMYECLTGRSPFAGALSYEQTVVRICSTEPVALETLAPACPAPVAEAVMRCLRKDREERPASARALENALDPEGTEDRASSSGRPPRRAAPLARDATTRGAPPPRRVGRIVAALGLAASVAALGAAARIAWTPTTALGRSMAARPPELRVEVPVPTPRLAATTGESSVDPSVATTSLAQRSATAAPSLQPARAVAPSKTPSSAESAAAKAPPAPSSARRGVAGSLVIQTQ